MHVCAVLRILPLLFQMDTHVRAVLWVLPEFLHFLAACLADASAKARVLPALFHLPAHEFSHELAKARVLPALFHPLAHARTGLKVWLPLLHCVARAILLAHPRAPLRIQESMLYN